MSIQNNYRKLMSFYIEFILYFLEALQIRIYIEYILLIVVKFFYIFENDSKMKYGKNLLID